MRNSSRDLNLPPQCAHTAHSIKELYGELETHRECERGRERANKKPSMIAIPNHHVIVKIHLRPTEHTHIYTLGAVNMPPYDTHMCVYVVCGMLKWTECHKMTMTMTIIAIIIITAVVKCLSVWHFAGRFAIYHNRSPRLRMWTIYPHISSLSLSVCLSYVFNGINECP